MAQEHVLAASASRTTTAGTNGDAVQLPAFWKRLIVVLDVTASGVDNGDTLSVYIDFSLNGSKWFNAARFATQAGDGAAKTEIAIFDPSTPAATTFAITSDCAAGVTKPYLFGKWARYRYVVVDGAGGGVPAHVFSVKAYSQ